MLSLSAGNRLRWLLLALALMFTSAVFGLLYIDAVGRISGWMGLPEYETYIPRLQSHARINLTLALIFPFLAAGFLGLSKRAETRHVKTTPSRAIILPEVSHEWSAGTTVLTYLIWLAISMIGSLAFMVVILGLENLVRTH
jgi:hypothetical protein